MNSRRAFLLAEETVKIILALIVVSFLVYLLTSLYFSGKKGKDLDLAQSSLDLILDSAGTNLETVELYNPEGWFVFSWPFEDQMPPQCKNMGWSNCLCICDEVNILGKVWSKLPLTGSLLVRQANKCLDKGVCMDSDISVQGQRIEIKSPFPLKLNLEYSDSGIILR